MGTEIRNALNGHDGDGSEDDGVVTRRDETKATTDVDDDSELSPLHHHHLHLQQRQSVQINDRHGNPSLYLDLDTSDNDDDDFHEHNLGRPITVGAGAGAGTAAMGSVVDGVDAYDDLSPPSLYPFGQYVRQCCRRAAAYPKCIWFYVQSARSQARQRRANLLLERQPVNIEEDDEIIPIQQWRRSVLLCCSSTCDDTDTGILFVAVFIIVWGLLLWIIRPSNVKRGIFIGGAVFLAMRLCSRPLWYYTQRHNRKRRSQHLPQELPQDSPTRGGGGGNGRTINYGETHGTMSIELASSSIVEQANKDGIFRQNDVDNNDNRFRTDSDEISSPGGLFITGSNESDPTIAAI